MSDSRKQPFTPEEFKDIYSKVTRLTVEVIVKQEQGVLLVERQEESWHGLWHIPGGSIHYKEHVHEAVSRLSEEELGVSARIVKMLGYIEYPSEEKERGFGWSIGMAFLCELDAEINDELLQKHHLRFFKQLPKNVVEEQRAILEQVLSE